MSLVPYETLYITKSLKLKVLPHFNHNNIGNKKRSLTSYSSVLTFKAGTNAKRSAVAFRIIGLVSQHSLGERALHVEMISTTWSVQKNEEKYLSLNNLPTPSRTTAANNNNWYNLIIYTSITIIAINRRTFHFKHFTSALQSSFKPCSVRAAGVAWSFLENCVSVSAITESMSPPCW